MRRVGDGELAELFGTEVVPIDKFMRSIRLRQAANETVDLLD